jgi:hypothetical protein
MICALTVLVLISLPLVLVSELSASVLFVIRWQEPYSAGLVGVLMVYSPSRARKVFVWWWVMGMH